jgi:hypothetical protein
MAFTKEQKRLWRLRPDVQKHTREYRRDWDKRNKTLNHWRYLEQRKPVKEYTHNCDSCHTIFITNQPNQRYCCNRCSRQVQFIRQYGWHTPHIEELLTKECERCKTPFQQTMARQRFCSHKCKERDKHLRSRTRHMVALLAARDELQIFPKEDRYAVGRPHFPRGRFQPGRYQSDFLHMSLQGPIDPPMLQINVARHARRSIDQRKLTSLAQLARCHGGEFIKAYQDAKATLSVPKSDRAAIGRARRAKHKPIKDAIWPLLQSGLLRETNIDRHARHHSKLKAAYQAVGDLLNTRRESPL